MQRAVLLVFLGIVSCTTNKNFSFSEYNCDGIEDWILEAQANSEVAHTIRLEWTGAQQDGDTLRIPLFSGLNVQEGYEKYFQDRYHPIIQQTHYIDDEGYVRGAALCFDAPVEVTQTGLKSMATIDQSTLIIEHSKICPDDTPEECSVIAMTYVPPARQ